MQTAKRLRQGAFPTLLALILFGFPTLLHAHTCVQQPLTLGEAYEVADRIIVGVIMECQDGVGGGPRASGGSSCSFTADEVLKDLAPGYDYRGVAGSYPCGLSLRPGGRYLLFLDGESQLMSFSAPLDGDSPRAQLAASYVQILRDFRSGAVDVLTEPWLFFELDQICTVFHSVGGNQIQFSRRRSDAPDRPEPEWHQGRVGGELVYKATIPITLGDLAGAPSENAEVVAFGNVPDFPDDAVTLGVSFRESPPAPLRRVTLSVGNATWPLSRIETKTSRFGASERAIVRYFAAGDVAERILSKMAQPADIVLTAKLIPLDPVSDAHQVAPVEPDLVAATPETGAVLSPVEPETRVARRSSTSDLKMARSSRAPEDLPDPMLRIVSRSTYLPNVLERFHACYAGEA